MGRKPNPKQGTLDLEPITERLVARITEAEKQMIERVAKVRHTSVSEVLRQESEKVEKERGEAA